MKFLGRHWEVWLYELPDSEGQPIPGPLYYDVQSRHRSHTAAIRAMERQPPAPANHYYRVVDRRSPWINTGWAPRPERRIDVTKVAPGGLERMAGSDARPSPAMQAAIERAYQAHKARDERLTAIERRLEALEANTEHQESK